jgi:hypothetical protein
MDAPGVHFFEFSALSTEIEPFIHKESFFFSSYPENVTTGRIFGTNFHGAIE